MAAPTPWSRFYMPHQYAPDVTGAPLPGAKLYFYASGTATPLDTFSEATLSIPQVARNLGRRTGQVTGTG